jgi:AraC-like DNA-binding protein
VGYRQPAQFAKAFRRHHGVSPSDYRAARRMGGVAAVDGNGASPHANGDAIAARRAGFAAA